MNISVDEVALIVLRASRSNDPEVWRECLVLIGLLVGVQFGEVQ